MLRSEDWLLNWMRLLEAVLLGVFSVCTASQTTAYPSAAILCESYNHACAQCNVSTSDGHVVSVQLIQQRSSTSCTANVTYGLTSDHTAIWVGGGCRGIFLPVLETDGTTLHETTSQRITSPTQSVTTKVETSESSTNPLPSSAHYDAVTESTEDASARNREVTSAAPLDSTTTSAPASEQPSSRGSSVSSGDVTLTTSHGVTSTIATAVSEAVSDATATDSSPRPTASALCHCACSRSSFGREAEIAALRADKASFSKSRRKKNSSRDDRMSSLVMGTAAVATLCAVAVIFLLLDLSHVISALQRARRMRQMPSSRPGTSGKTDTLKVQTFKLNLKRVTAPDIPLRDSSIC